MSDEASSRGESGTSSRGESAISNRGESGKWRTWAAASEPYGAGRKAGIGALLDPTKGEDLLERLQRYKRQVAKRYRIVEPERVEALLPTNEPLHISPKLDGELWFLVHRGGDTALVAFNGRVLHGITCLAGVNERLASAPDLVIAGELVAAAPGEGRSRSHHVATALSDGKLEPTISFHAFVLYEDGGVDVLGRPYTERHARLVALLGGLPSPGSRPASDLRGVHVVETRVGDASLAASLYREWVKAGRAEGIVVRSDRGLTYKIKPTFTVDLLVVAYGERLVDGTRQVRELQVGLFRDDGTVQLVGSVGTGLSDEDRVRWHGRLSAIEAKSSFRLANREGTLCRFVTPTIVVEVRVSDLLAADGWDIPIRRMALAHDPAKGWSAVAELRTAVLLHPVLMRERTDKTATLAACGMTQITSYLDDAGVEAVPTVSRASAEIIRRAVFTKVTKGETAVRKVLVVRTHKEREGTHPPFVVFASDYSGGRRAPLETALKSAANVEDADAQVRAWVVENVKKGWAEVEARRLGAPLIESVAAPTAATSPPSGDAKASSAPVDTALAGEPLAAAEPAKPKRTRAKKA